MSDPPARRDDPLLLGPNAWLIEELQARWEEFPDSVGEQWRAYLAGEEVPSLATEAAASAATPSSAPPADSPATPGSAPTPSSPTDLPQGAELMRGAAARIVENMEESLGVPTATSVREMPVRMLEENRRVVNQVLAERSDGKLSFTHVIAWAIIEALRIHPDMGAVYADIDGAPHRIMPEHLNFGLAVDVRRKDGSRGLLVPNLKAVDTLDFAGFVAAYDTMVGKVRAKKIQPDDFFGTTVTLTNPGMIGTAHSIPRLMADQALIVGIGAIQWPAAYRSADPRTMANLGVSKTMSVTSTYDHRVIQGAESGAFLQTIDRLLSGEEDFYTKIFRALSIPFRPIVGTRDRSPHHDLGAGGLVEKEAKVLQLVNMYRVRGHLIANTNPLSTEVPEHSELDPATYGLTVWDFDREFITGGLGGPGDRDRTTLRDILETMREAYCQTIGLEFMHIQEPAQKRWLRDRIEGRPRSEWIQLHAKRRILDKLNAAEAFERFLHTKYVGHKRFSLEGAETLIPTLDYLFTRAIDAGIEEAVMGMAHRGRLNVLGNILGKGYGRMFREFEGDIDPETLDGSGDVKYHLGAIGVHRHPDGRSIPLTLASNPSHLEAVDPVVEGMVRAKQDERGDTIRRRVLPVLIHGDAAFAGQGVVAETLNLSGLQGYRTGGTIHIVVNNRIGFTTSPVDARSSVHPTDVARMVQAPIFHVNGHDPEACAHVMDLALGFRQEFQKDVVIDLQVYRRHGHNESDEPAFTQPMMYRQIGKMRPIRLLYSEALVKRGDIAEEDAEELHKDFHARLEAAFEATHESKPPEAALPKDATPEDALPSVASGVERPVLDRVLAAVSGWPDDLNVHPKLQRQLAARGRMLEDDAVDWATAEALALGSLLLNGTSVRLSGQDSRRGTFAHRHAVLIDQETGEEWAPLEKMEEDQGRFQVFDSLLSEYAVLGFDYGYSVEAPEGLVLWEAQFGDFVNGAQIILDQFLSSAEEKWRQKSRLVMLLPHGFEGQGPEHSSARLERFLTLCARRNMRVAAPTTSAQYFHLLRRQALQDPPKPLVVMTPKSLLRSPQAKSPAAAFETGRFRHLVEDPPPGTDARDVRRILLCAGKVAYDLTTFRASHEVEPTVIARLEQLYPFPGEEIADLLRRHPNATHVKWVQEEPMNMGAWNYFVNKMRGRLPDTHRLTFAGRPGAGSPATGSHSMHVIEQAYLVQQAFFT